METRPSAALAKPTVSTPGVVETSLKDCRRKAIGISVLSSGPGGLSESRLCFLLPRSNERTVWMVWKKGLLSSETVDMVKIYATDRIEDS